ncbi:MAG: hypothetical protein EA362_00880 [Saprospirales bacterium]|nr:MAG: hypothetical protein EA362_00880 [Saprospirales bacterium]
MKKILFLTALIFCITNVYGQISFGVQADIGKSQLFGISNEAIVPYGFSGAKYNQDIEMYASPSLRLRMGLSDRLFWESGIGYHPLSYSIQLSHFHPLFSRQLDGVLNINLHYLSIPLSIGYSLPVLERSKIITNLGINTAILLSYSDNYLDIIWEDYLQIGGWYSQFVFKPFLSIAYQSSISQTGGIEIGCFISTSIKSFASEDKAWGFFNNLASARSLSYGLQLKYFFTTN